MTEIKSPCIGVCEIDKKGLFCVGCLRSIQEISDWKIFSKEQKMLILDKIKKRKQ